jgi:hypothetical protein
MSLETVKSERSRKVVLGSLVGSAAILVVSWWGLRREEPAASAAATAPPAWVSSAGGVQAAAVDSARWNPDPAEGDEVKRAAAVQVPVAVAVPERIFTARGEVPPEAVAQRAADLAADAERDRRLAELRAGPTAALRSALAGRRAALARACLTGDAPDSVTVTFHARFAGDGSLLDHSVGGEAAAVVECLKRQPFALEVPASESGIAVSTELTLP